MSPRRPEAAPVTAPHPIELPTINLLVRLIGPAGAGDPAGLASRIEDIAAPAPGRPVAFRVVVPTYPGDLLDDPADVEHSDVEHSGVDRAGDGDAGDGDWLMTWVSERGRWELPVRRSDAEGPGPRSWWLSPAGQLRRNQRRSFYRVACSGAVAVDVLAEPFLTLTGRTVDVSEGGLCCQLPTTGVEAGTRVVVRPALDGLTGAFDGVVRRVRRPARAARVAGWHRELAIAFDNPEARGEELRQFVVRTQLKRRRLATV